MGLIRRLAEPFVTLAIPCVMLTAYGCDPCAGLASCQVAPTLTIEGHLVDPANGASVDGAGVSLVVASGGAAGRDSISTTSDARGFWQLTARTHDRSPVTFDIVVSPPGLPVYRVAGLSRQPSTTAGEGYDVGSWVKSPYFAIAGELWYRGAFANKIRNAPVTFTRTGGAQLSGTGYTATGYHTVSDTGGRIALFGPSVVGEGLAPVVGDLVVDLGFTTSTVHGVALTPTYVFQSPFRVMVLPAGPLIGYRVYIVDRSTSRPVTGIQVDFQRTGGVATAPNANSWITDAFGSIVIYLRPLAVGSVVGDLTIHSPVPAKTYTVTGLTLPTYDADTARVYGSFPVDLAPAASVTTSRR